MKTLVKVKCDHPSCNLETEVSYNPSVSANLEKEGWMLVNERTVLCPRH